MTLKTVQQGRALLLMPDGSYAERVVAVPKNGSEALFRPNFAKTRSAVDDQFFDQLISGTGHSISQANGNLLIVAGTTLGSEALIRSKQSFLGNMAARVQFMASQRIAGNNFYALLADKIGDNLAAVATTTTNINVTIPGHSFTAESIGQGIMLGALAGGLAGSTGGRVTIAAVAGDVVSFTGSGFVVASGTVSLFGWNYAQVLWNGTVATTSQFDMQRRGWNSGNTAVQFVTSASPGHMAIFGMEDGVGSVSDQATASGTTVQISARGSRVVNLPDETTPLYLYLWSLNSAAPASSTTFTIGMVQIEDYETQRVSITNVRPQARQTGAPMAVVEALPAGTNSIGSIGALVAGTALAADVGVQMRATAGGIATTAKLPSSAATTNATVAKASAGRIAKIDGLNTNVAARYLKLYNKATAPTVGTDVPVRTLALKAADKFEFNIADIGYYFSAGISYAITANPADNDSTAIGAGDITGLNIDYI